MWASDRQAARAIRVLLATVRLEDLWTLDGPTERAIELRDADGGPLSSGERLLLLTAWDLWEAPVAGKGVRLADLMYIIDNERLSLLFSLVLALTEGSAAVDRWLEAHNAPELH